ncbi:transcription repressor NadR [Bengtsoniella intestinalis]|uniref:transcription repressor NadR n=1 Tax=Bengtsoniella intestinalis TaxID=3073143 RepID=UPI00391F6D8C
MFQRRATMRRDTILTLLAQATAPLSASNLASQLGVSRQVIVGDIALLRAAGHTITPTPKGYLLSQASCQHRCQIVCQHTPEDTAIELNILVDHGCTVEDVTVEHPVYGQLTGQLQLQNRYDVSQFLAQSAGVPPLAVLTQGIHLHTISAPDADALARAKAELQNAGFLYEN